MTPSDTDDRFCLNDDQAALVALARDFAADRIAPHALAWDRDRHFPVDVLREAAALGFGAVTVRDDLGGSGLSRLDSTLIFEALAEACPTVAAYLSIHNMVAALVDRFGTPEQRERWLPDLVGMARLASYCLTEPEAGSDAAALRTRARRDGACYVLDGQKQFISGAGQDDSFYLVMARSGQDGASGISSFVVEAGTKGLSFGPNEHKMGWNAQPTRAVIFEGCRVPAENRLGAEGQGFKIAMAGLDGGRLNITACSIGGAQAATDKALAYTAERRAFGRKLDEFQALQFRLAEMAIKLEAARSLLWRAASALDRGDPRATTLCAMAKSFGTEAGFDVADAALQLHGGYGYLADYGVEKLVRDLRVHRILEGTNEMMRLIVARSLIEAVR